MRAFLWILLVGVVGQTLCAQEAPATIQCVSCWEMCSEAMGVQSPSFLKPQAVCEKCVNLKTRCFECGLPIKNRGKQLGDGRQICAQHSPQAVENLQSALTLLKETQRDLMHMLSGFGSLPEANVKLELVDVKEMGQLLQRGQLLHPANATVGLSQTTVQPDGRLTHRIWILSGFSPNRFSAIAAHEYTHCWVSENVQRTIEAATVEGFCELIALKMCEKRGDRAEQQVILANNYTQGRIQALQRAAQSYQVPQIVEWIKRGEDRTVTVDKPERVLAMNQPAQPALYQLGQAVKTPVPETLTLKGISGPPGRRLALVNDRTLELNEQGRVRVGTTNLTVRCLKISERSVVVQLLATGERRELFLVPDHK